MIRVGIAVVSIVFVLTKSVSLQLFTSTLRLQSPHSIAFTLQSFLGAAYIFEELQEGGALDKGKSKQDAKDEKEKKRRSSLTDSPLTSSSSSSASTASRDSDDVDTNKRKSVSPNSKASDNETEEISTSLATSKLADDSRQNINQEASDEDKNRKSKNKRKKKKKVIDEISPNFANINDNAREAGGKCGIGKSDEPQPERSQQNPSKASSPLLLNSGSWTVNPLAARQSAGRVS
uniref:Uncharacterized protein n=1 Tax=Ditylenchus dipsaci TaxID=166011 RepID=A0A915DIV5_9BILA